MPYGIIKVDQVTFTNAGVDQTISVSGIVASISGNITATGTISGNVIRGGTLVSGATVTGTAGQFGTITGNTAGFTTVTGTTVTGTTANFVTVSGTTITGTTAQFTTVTGGTAGFTTITGTTVTGTTANFVAVSGTTVTGNVGNFTTITGGSAGFTTVTGTTITGTTLTVASGTFTGNSTAAAFIPTGSTVPTNGVYLPSANNVAISTNGVQRLTTDTAAVTSTLPVLHPLGAVGTPSITFTGDLNTGIWSPAADTVAASTGGSERLRIDSSGRVGIGTTAPSEALTVAGNIRANNTNAVIGAYAANTSSPQFILGNSAGTAHYLIYETIDGSGNRGALNIYDAVAATNRLTVDTSGRLLVGTSSARSGFVVATVGAAIQLEGAGGDFANPYRAISATFNKNNAEGPVVFLTKTRSASNGGTTIVQSADELGTIWFCGADGTNLPAGASIAAYVDGTPGANDMPGRLVFSTTADGASSPTEALRITSGQNLRIGTTAEGAGFNNGRVRLVGNTGGLNSIYCEQTQSGGYSFASNCVSNGGIYYHANFMEVGTSRGSITSNGSSTTYSTSSDYRLKENIELINDGIARLQQLKPSRFNFIENAGNTVDGFIAHEVQAVVPEAIVGEKDAVDDDGNPIYQGIDQSKLVPLLTAALQEAITKIETLEAKVAALEAA